MTTYCRRHLRTLLGQRLAIIAGTNVEAQQWADYNSLHATQWVYVDVPARIIGLKSAPYVRVGTWRDGVGDRWHELEALLLSLDARHLGDFGVAEVIG